ncbi:FkbM family methyltransferase [Psychroserpens sp.]
MTKKEFIKNISQKERDKRLDLIKLKNEQKPLILYGIGDYANTVYNFLKDNGITVDYVCVNKEFSSEKSWKNIPLVFKEELDSTLKEAYNVVIGFSRFKEAEKQLEKCELLADQYFFDSISFFDFFNYEYIVENADKFVETYNLLSDNKSQEILLAFINGKLLGKPEALYDLMEGRQYFPKDIIQLTSSEAFVDAGAYVGDTLITFLENVNNEFDSYFAFEPDIKNYQMLQNFVDKSELEKVSTYNLGVSNKKAQLRFKSDLVNTVKSNFSEDGDLVIDVDSIDNILDGKRATFIKMDIEGAEYDALNGAKETIKKYKPKLAVSMYHKQDDLFKLPDYIKSLRPDYKFYLRHHMHITQELVLYAI